MDNTNYIISEIYIKEDDINSNRKIINSFENAKKERKWKDRKTDHIYENEKEIKKCEIQINGVSIPFCYFYTFSKKGKYNIKYSFPCELTNINCIFYECEILSKIDLSNFNTQNVTCMKGIFFGCKSLTNIDLSQSAIDMSDMLGENISLLKINIK